MQVWPALAKRPKVVPLGRLLEIGARPDDGGRLAAQFQRDGGKVLGGSRHDDLADLRAAGEEDVVER